MSSRAARKPKDRGDSKAASKSRGSVKPSPEGTKEGEQPWSLRLYDTRQWGQRLGRNGGSDPAVVKRLLKTLRDPRAPFEGALRRTAIEALTPAAAVGHRGALAAQTAALADGSETVRRSALECLGAAAGAKRAEAGGAVAVALAEALPRGCSAEAVEVRRARAAALLQLAPRGDRELTSIATAWLGDGDAEVRRASVRALGAIGDSPAAVATVAERLADPDWRVRQAAVKALERLAGERRPATKSGQDGQPPAGSAPPPPQPPPVEAKARGRRSQPAPAPAPAPPPPGPPKLSKAEQRRVNAEAAAVGALARSCSEGALLGLQRVEALAALRASASLDNPGVLEAAAARLADPDADVRQEAAQLLLGLEDSELAARTASGCLSHPDFRVRAAARRALLQAVAEVPETAATALGRTAATLESSDWAGRRGAARGLRQLGESSGAEGLEAALGSLLPRLRHTDWSVRRKAAQAVAEVAGAAGGSEQAVGMLAAAAADADEDVRLAAAAALPRAAPQKSRRAVCLVAQLATEDPVVTLRVCALESMEALAGEGRSRSRTAVHAAARCLEDESAEVRAAADRVLRSIGRDRRTTVDALAQCLQHPDEGVRLAAAAVFDIVRGRRERVQLRVIKLLQHPEEGVRAAAKLAMSSLAEQHEAAPIAVAAQVLARLRRLQPQAAEPSPAPAPAPTPAPALAPAAGAAGARGRPERWRPAASGPPTASHEGSEAAGDAAPPEEEGRGEEGPSDSETESEGGGAAAPPPNALALLLG